MSELTGEPMYDLPIVAERLCNAAVAFTDCFDPDELEAAQEALTVAANTYRGCALWARSKGISLSAVAS